MAKAKPKLLWVGFANMFGLSPKPIRVTYDKYNFCYYDREGNLDVMGEGLEEVAGWVKFASVDKEEVKTFIRGYRAAQTLLKNFTE
jgi:hypothetical protein